MDSLAISERFGLIIPPTEGAPFQASIEFRQLGDGRDQRVHGKLFRDRHGRVRLDLGSLPFEMSQIFDHPGSIHLTINHSLRIVQKRALTVPTELLLKWRSPSKSLGKRIGRKQVEAIRCTVYRSETGPFGGESWYAEELGLVVFSEVHGPHGVLRREIRDIRMGDSEDPSLFEIPSGYRVAADSENPSTGE